MGPGCSQQTWALGGRPGSRRPLACPPGKVASRPPSWGNTGVQGGPSLPVWVFSSCTYDKDGAESRQAMRKYLVNSTECERLEEPPSGLKSNYKHKWTWSQPAPQQCLAVDTSPAPLLICKPLYLSRSLSFSICEMGMITEPPFQDVMRIK